MTSWIDWTTGYLWTNALAVLAPAALVAVITRSARFNPATRHALWMIVLLLFILPPMGFARRLLGITDANGRGQAMTHQGTTANMGEPDHLIDLDLRSEIPNSAHFALSGPADPCDAAETLKSAFSNHKSIENTPPGEASLLPLIDSTLSLPLTPPRTGVGVDSPASASLAWTLPSTRHPSPTFAANDMHRASPTIGSTSAAQRDEPNNIGALLDSGLTLASMAPEFVFAPTLTATRHAAQTMHSAPHGAALPVASPVGPFAHGSPAAPGPAVWQPVMEYAVALREAILVAAARVPQMPTGVWLWGTVLIVIARLISLMRGRRLLATSSAAPNEVHRLVVRCARRLGLRNLPSVRMMQCACPPMVLGLIRSHLLIPTSLWQQLDPVGRQAIILHELAHVRRRDLWVRRFERFVSALCWWHPVVWYARHRLNEEAEHCCDAWVTWLLPRERRTYATALLQAQVFVQQSHPVDPAVGIGVVSVRAKRLARRLTMVMTHPSRPALSASGLCAVAAIALAGWISAPAWANLPNDSAPAGQTQATTTQQPAPPSGEPAPLPDAPTPNEPTPPPIAGEATMFIEAESPILAYTTLANGSFAPLAATVPLLGQSDDKAMEDRMHRLEEQLRRLEERLAKFGETPGTPRIATAMPSLPRAAVRSTSATATPPVQAARPARPVTPRAPLAPRVRGIGRGGAAGGGPGAIGQTGEELYSQVHSVTPGKLEALLNLMARQDVPVFVARTDGGIEVTATAGQHQVFSAFVAMIDPQVRQKVSANINERTPEALARQELTRAMSERDRARQLAAEQELVAAGMTSTAQDRAKLAEELQSVAAAQSSVAQGSRSYSDAYSLYNEGDYVAALELFRKSADVDHRRGESLYNMACCEALLGNHDESLDLLEQAWEAGYRQLDHIQQDDDLNTLRDDERYKSFIDERATR